MADNGNDLYYSGDLEVIAANLNNPDAIVNQDPGERGLNPYYVSDAMKTALFLLLLVGFGIKLPIFPFHTWMLRVHAEAPPPLVMIHSGILLKMGAYGLLRFGVFLFPEQAERWALLLAILGVINILYGAVIAFVQKEFKLILAYSSISHMGIVLIGLAALNEAGVKGAVFQLVSHGLISALLFLIVGSLHERTGTTDIRELGGLAKSMPFMCGVLIVAGLASLGLPGLSGFVGELMAFLGLFDVLPAVTIVGALGIILAAVYVLRGVMRIMHGPLPERFQGVKDARLIEAIPMIALVAFIVLLGVYPAVLGGTLEPAIQDFMLRIGG
jgi:NADH-quinone oxidoreductase subunit M